jgi:hypothetical protein
MQSAVVYLERIFAPQVQVEEPEVLVVMAVMEVMEAMQVMEAA